MTRTRYTSDYVRTVADAARTLTGGAFAYGYTSNPGDGVRYVDGVKQIVWTGRTGARQAAAYYAGAASAWNALQGGTVGTLPDVLRAAAHDAAYSPVRAVQAAYSAGHEDASYRYSAQERRQLAVTPPDAVSFDPAPLSCGCAPWQDDHTCDDAV